MLAILRSYHILARFMALAICVASVLPFIQHACEMAGSEASHKKCCCIAIRESSNHAPAKHEHTTAGKSMHASHVHTMPEAKESHMHGDHESEAGSMDHEAPCDNHGDGVLSGDDCCTWETFAFSTKAVKASKAALNDYAVNAVLEPVFITELEEPPPKYHSELDYKSPPLILPDRQILFATFLI